MEYNIIELLTTAIISFLFGIGISSNREKKKWNSEKDKLINQLKVFWNRRNIKETKHIIIMDAISCGLDINKIIEVKGSFNDVFQRWWAYRNLNYSFDQEYCGSSVKTGMEKHKRKKSKKNIDLPDFFSLNDNQDISLNKYKNLKYSTWGPLEDYSLNEFERKAYHII